MGPDLAKSTVAPPEFIDFLRLHLKDRFIGNDDQIKQAVENVDTTPDHDGRFRVTEFFCRDHCWRTVFARLANERDVLFDLRGFSKTNSGCQYELTSLLNLVSLERVLFVVDESTNEEFLLGLLCGAWEAMPETSPNRRTHRPSLRMFRETGRWRLDHEELFQLLCDNVSRSRSQSTTLGI